MGQGSSGPARSQYNVFSNELSHRVVVKRALVIANGAKSGIDATIQRVQTKAGEIELDVRRTKYAGHASDLARGVSLREFDALCVIGGDGSFHEVVNGMMKREDGLILPLCILPGGSGNTFAYDLRVHTIEEGVEALVQGDVRCVDLVEVTKYADDALPEVDAEAAPAGMLTGQAKTMSVGAIGDAGEVKATSSPFPERLPTTSAHLGATRLDEDTVYGINMVGWALPASVLHTATTTCRCCGVAQYNLAAYQHLIRNKTCPATVRYKGPDAPEADSGGYVMVQVQTTVHMGDKMPFCPNAKLDDGLLDVVLVPRGGRLRLVSFMEAAKVGTHVGRRWPEIVYKQAAEVIIRPAREEDTGPDSLNVDGELIHQAPCRLRAMKQALPIFVPPQWM